MRRRQLFGGARATVLAAAAVLTAAAGYPAGSWTIQPTPNPPGATAVSILLGLSCSAPSACTAVGVHFGSGSAESTLAERWNGSRWDIEPTPGGRNPLNAVSCTSRVACMAVGGDGQTLAEQWNGSGWSVRPTPDPSHGTRMALLSVSCTGQARASRPAATPRQVTLRRR